MLDPIHNLPSHRSSAPLLRCRCVAGRVCAEISLTRPSLPPPARVRSVLLVCLILQGEGRCWRRQRIQGPAQRHAQTAEGQGHKVLQVNRSTFSGPFLLSPPFLSPTHTRSRPYWMDPTLSLLPSPSLLQPPPIPRRHLPTSAHARVRLSSRARKASRTIVPSRLPPSLRSIACTQTKQLFFFLKIFPLELE